MPSRPEWQSRAAAPENLDGPRPEGTPGLGRRSFLRRGAGAAAIAAVGVVAGEAEAASTGVPELYRGGNAKQFRAFMTHENAHVQAEISLIQQLGGTPRPKPNFKNLLRANPRDFVTVTIALENTGTGAYLGALPAVMSATVVKAAGSVAQIEARHSGWVNTVFNFLQTRNVFGQDQSFERPLTIQEVINSASPFIQDLNGGPPLMFDPVNKSAANDIDILNFALALEYLEADFYNINVPKFF